MDGKVVVVCCAFAAATMAFTDPVRAADPTTADCLAARAEGESLAGGGKLRDARAQFFVCAAASSCPVDVRKQCKGRLEEVNAQIATVVFEAQDASGNDIHTVKVIVDGKVLAEHLERYPVSV